MRRLYASKTKIQDNDDYNNDLSENLIDGEEKNVLENGTIINN